MPALSGSRIIADFTDFADFRFPVCLTSLAWCWVSLGLVFTNSSSQKCVYSYWYLQLLIPFNPTYNVNLTADNYLYNRSSSNDSHVP